MNTSNWASQREWSRRFCVMLAVTTLVLTVTLTCQRAFAHFVYRLDSNADSASALHEYNTDTNSWSVRAALPTNNYTSITSDGNSAFALPADGNIYRYNRPANTWDFVMAGPAAAVGAGPIAMLETRGGEFYWGKDGSSTLYYTVGGVWNSISTPRPVSSGSDIDRQNGRIYIRTYGELGGFAYDIASNSFPLVFDQSTGILENSRVGAYYDGLFYTRSFSGNLLQVNPNSNSLVDTGVLPATTHSSMAVSSGGLLYMNGYSDTETKFEVFDINTNTLTPLADAPFYGGNSHPSLAWVAVPEPHSLVLSMIAATLAMFRRKRGQ